jgi:hypothetical protein
MLLPRQGGWATWHTGCRAAAAVQTAESAEPQQTAAPLTRQEHNRAQTKEFSKLEAVQASRQPPDLPIYQASALLAAEAAALALLHASATMTSTRGLSASLHESAVLRQKLERIAAAVPGLGADSRVIDVGTGAGVLIQHLQVHSILTPCKSAALKCCAGHGAMPRLQRRLTGLNALVHHEFSASNQICLNNPLSSAWPASQAYTEA